MFMDRSPSKRPLTKTIEFIAASGAYRGRIDVAHYGPDSSLPSSLPATGVIETSTGERIQFSGELEGLTVEDFKKKGGRPRAVTRDMAVMLAAYLHQAAGGSKPESICEVANLWCRKGYPGMSETSAFYAKVAKMREEIKNVPATTLLAFTGTRRDAADACAFIFWPGGSYSITTEGLEVTAPFTFWQYGDEHAQTICGGTYLPIRANSITLVSQKTSV